MGRLSMKNVCQKGGRTYLRRKVAGRDTYIRLPDLADPDFASAYQLATTPIGEKAKAPRGSVGALIAAYRASSEFRAIPSETTRVNYSRYLDMIAQEHGHRSVTGVTPHHIYNMRDAMQDTPGKANNWLNVFKRLMAYAAKHGLRRDDPASRISALPLGEREPWPAEVLEAALDQASPMVRLAIITGLCSGARIGDVIRLQHGWHDGEIMEFMASKNKADVAVPMHPLWKEELAKVPRKSVTLLYDRSGKPFGSTDALRARVRDLMTAIGAPQYTFHGLRKNAACYLAELGLSDGEIGAIVGMTPQTVRHYTKRKRALMIARGAADRIKKGDILDFKGGRDAITVR